MLINKPSDKKDSKKKSLNTQTKSLIDYFFDKTFINEDLRKDLDNATIQNPKTGKPVKVRSVLYNKKHPLYPQALAIYKKLKTDRVEQSKKNKKDLDQKEPINKDIEAEKNQTKITINKPDPKTEEGIQDFAEHLNIDPKKIESIKNVCGATNFNDFENNFKKNINPDAKKEDISLAWNLWNSKNPEEVKNIVQEYIKNPKSSLKNISKSNINIPQKTPQEKAELERRRDGIEKMQKTLSKKVSSFDIDQLNDLELEKCKDENELQQKINLVYNDNTQVNKDVFKQYKNILFPFNKTSSDGKSSKEKQQAIDTKNKLEGREAAVNKIHDKLKTYVSGNEWKKLKDANLENITDKEVLKHEINQIFEPGKKNQQIYDLYRKALFPFDNEKAKTSNNKNNSFSTGDYIDDLPTSSNDDITDSSESSPFDDVTKNNMGKYMALGIMGAFAAGSAVLTKKVFSGMWNSFKDFLNNISNKK